MIWFFDLKYYYLDIFAYILHLWIHFTFQELHPKPGDQQVSHQILGNFLLLATKQKANAERALQDFMNIASQESYKNHVGAILGMATAYMILKQVS